ncbi:MAG: DNA-directed RNA polymerase subunit H [Candidatus Woesearchaeota archaeon]
MVKKKKVKSKDSFDIKEHVLVPKHEKCSEAEKKRVLEQYRATIKDFPKISINDPALFHLEVIAGDLIKITRESQTAGKVTFYRVVIEI